MANKKTIYPLASRLQYPPAGEEVLASLRQWAAADDSRAGSPAGLIELNWPATSYGGFLYDRVVSGRQRPLFSLTVEQAMAMLDELERERLAPQILYFTGADPAGHPQLGEFIELARQSGVSSVGLQCSGPRLAHDDRLLDLLNREKPFLFVDFDSFDETASLILHGRRDLPFEAKRGLDRLAAAGLPATLLAGVVQGVNLQEVGAIAAFGLKHPAVLSAIFRPVAPRPVHPGAGSSSPGLSTPVTAAAIMAALEQQSRGLFRQDAFVPAPGCQPACHFCAQVPYAGQNGATLAGRPTSALAGNAFCMAPDGAPCYWLDVHEFTTPWSNDLDPAQRCPLLIMTPDGRTIPYRLGNAPAG